VVVIVEVVVDTVAVPSLSLALLLPELVVVAVSLIPEVGLEVGPLSVPELLLADSPPQVSPSQAVSSPQEASRPNAVARAPLKSPLRIVLPPMRIRRASALGPHKPA